jgi:kinetochore protein Nuf2
VFEWFAELLMNTTRETVEPAMRAAADDICGDYVEIVPADTRNLMGFFVSLRKLLVQVNDPDSTLIIKMGADTLYGDPVRNQ